MGSQISINDKIREELKEKIKKSLINKKIKNIKNKYNSNNINPDDIKLTINFN